jgi:hypothetical protein
MNFQVPPDLYVFAVNLRQVVENDTPIRQGLMFALGRRYGLTVKTLAGMAKCSQSHVRRMLRLLELPNEDFPAVQGNMGSCHREHSLLPTQRLLGRFIRSE